MRTRASSGRLTFSAIEPTASTAEKAYLILKYAHDSATSLLAAHEHVRQRRVRKKRLAVRGGATTDEEQDLLRAMLVFAAAGLDATLKQLIRDCVTALAEQDSSVQANLEKFALRRLRAIGAEGADPEGLKLLASVLAAASPRQRLLEAYVDDRTGGSLQSRESLCRSLEALGIAEKDISLDGARIDQIFKKRNQIVHELDINFNHPKRNRQTRRLGDMLEDTRILLDLGARILAAVNAKLTARGLPGGSRDVRAL